MREFSNEEKYTMLQALKEKSVKSREQIDALRGSKWPDEMRSYINGLRKDLVVLKRLEDEFQSEVTGLVVTELSIHT